MSRRANMSVNAARVVVHAHTVLRAQMWFIYGVPPLFLFTLLAGPVHVRPPLLVHTLHTRCFSYVMATLDESGTVVFRITALLAAVLGTRYARINKGPGKLNPPTNADKFRQSTELLWEISPSLLPLPAAIHALAPCVLRRAHQLHIDLVVPPLDNSLETIPVMAPVFRHGVDAVNNAHTPVVRDYTMIPQMSPELIASAPVGAEYATHV